MNNDYIFSGVNIYETCKCNCKYLQDFLYLNMYVTVSFPNFLSSISLSLSIFINIRRESVTIISIITDIIKPNSN